MVLGAERGGRIHFLLEKTTRFAQTSFFLPENESGPHAHKHLWDRKLNDLEFGDFAMKARTCWEAVCTVDDLVADSGIAVWTDDGPVAVFYLPHRLPALFAISHTDPFSGSNVLARGITGDLNGEPVVASPLYKQHFSLRTGRCLEDEGVQVRAYPVLLDGNRIRLEVPVAQTASVAA